MVRIAGSAHADRFVLKGARLLHVHAADVDRPTRDLDLLGFGSDDADDLVRVFREICDTPVEPDGLRFDASSGTGEAIRETARYGGVRDDGRWGGTARKRGWNSTTHVRWFLRQVGLDPAAAEADDGKPSRLVTLPALRVLDWAAS